MSNDFYTPSLLTRHTLARSSAVNAQLTAIQSGFGLLPGKDKLNQNRWFYYTDGGAANVYTITMSPTLTAYAAGLCVRVYISTTNTGASTLNVDSLGAKAIKRADGSDVEAGDLTAGDIHEFIYDGTAFQMKSMPRSYMSGTASGAANVVAFGALASAADKLGYFTGSGAMALTDLTSFARTLLDDANGSTALTTLGVSSFAQTLLDDADAATARTTLGISTFGSTLLDDADASAARTTLGLGTIATQAADSVNIDGGAIDGTTIGASTAAAGTFTDLTATNLTASGTINFDSADFTAGSVTPTLDGTTGSPSAVGYNGQTGRYVRIGNLMFVHLVLGVTSVTGGSGVGVIGGLPGTPAFTGVTVYSASVGFATGHGAAVVARARYTQTEGGIVLYDNSDTAINLADYATSQVNLSIWYEVT